MSRFRTLSFLRGAFVMGNAILLLPVIVILAAIGCVAFFERDWFMQQIGQGKQQIGQAVEEAKGLPPSKLVYRTPAKSPDEALKKFREAVKVRDYEAAAGYCGGEYGEQ